MRDLGATVLALLLGAVLLGCGDGTSTETDDSASPAATPGQASPAAGSAPADSGRAIPDGSYSKTVTVAQARAMGITDRGFLRQLGSDGTTTFVFKFQGNRWTEFVVEEAPEPGDVGTLEYDAKDDVVMTSASDGCPGCVYTYDWSLVGDELTLRLVGHESTDSPADVVIDRFVTAGAFTRQS